ncbi:gamma-glutamyltransferase [Sphingomonas sp. KC8]|uniref:gamma-glutamyltransferase n=1 Tax=Sphingomonas sp. KC8 TaxID=1030157 RepID=UPI0002488650|nr:gamma-glutamyltransferase [Sphingomonas sp. KC8]ARS27926.1 gamma-glutamyltransferase [Sphingomonas sp. KC8]
MIVRILLLLALLIAPLTAPTAASAAGGVVSAADPRAAEAGREMLRAGGSATDAAMAMMLALSVVEPQSSGIGGGGLLVHHDGKTGAIATIDGREAAPAAATPGRFTVDGQPMSYRDAFQGGHSVGIPGNIRLMADAHRQWGKLPWARLFEPAIRLADQGYAVTPRLHNALKMVAPLWDAFPDIRAIYWQDGKPAAVGATIRNPALAKLLRDVAASGPDAFYAGEHGAAIAAAVTAAPRNPAPLTLADLASYQAKDRPAVCGNYRRYRVCGMGPPSSGATTILQMLGMIERFDIGRLGKDSPEAWHLIGEAMQLAYADREKYLGDVDFVAVPLAGLVDRDYLARRSALISPARSLAVYEAGTPPGAEPRTAAISGERAGTTHFVAVDGAGDVVSMTSTVEGPFGSQLVASGMVLNNELTDFTFAPEKDGAPVANRVEAGKRPLSSMSPTIVYGPDGKVVLAIGSAGGKRIIMHVMKALVGVIDWKLPAADAMALPNIYFGGGSLLVEQGTSLDAMRPALERLGQPVTAADLPSKLNAVERTAKGWRGAADPRSEGVALAE